MKTERVGIQFRDDAAEQSPPEQPWWELESCHPEQISLSASLLTQVIFLTPHGEVYLTIDSDWYSEQLCSMALKFGATITPEDITKWHSEMLDEMMLQRFAGS